MNNHYIYIWKEQGVAGSGLPFYVGQGKHCFDGRKDVYRRASQTHHREYCQLKANKLARLGTPHVVEILHDHLTQEEANALEKTLIKRLGRRVNNTGILTNIQEGGHFNPWESSRDKLLDAMKSEKRSRKISEKVSKKITYEGVEYQSKTHLANHLGITLPALIKLEQNGFKRRNRQRMSKFVVNGEEFNTVEDVAERFGLTKGIVYYRMKNNIPMGNPVKIIRGKNG